MTDSKKRFEIKKLVAECFPKNTTEGALARSIIFHDFKNADIKWIGNAIKRHMPEMSEKVLRIGSVRGSLYHPDYGYSSPKELIEKGVSVYSGLTNQGDRITSWEYKMIDGRAYIANHLMQEGSITLLNCI